MSPPPDLRQDPAARRVRKRPVAMSVVFASAPGTVRTLEGEVRHAAGDAVVTGVCGERWPVRRAAFLASYAPVPPLQPGLDGAYIKRPVTAFALPLAGAMTVPLADGNGVLQARPGDWLLQYPDGSHGVVSGEIFAATYEDA